MLPGSVKTFESAFAFLFCVLLVWFCGLWCEGGKARNKDDGMTYCSLRRPPASNAKRCEGASLRLYLPLLPFVNFEFCAMAICCTWDCGSRFASAFVAWVCGANVRNNDVVVWLQRPRRGVFVSATSARMSGGLEEKLVAFLFFRF